MDEYSKMFYGGVSGEMPQIDPMSPDFAMMQQPAQIDPSQFVRPVTSTEEMGQRRSMWNDLVTKFKTNPNLQRAMFMTGAMMMQPIQPGQTAGGQLANAGVVGLNAYTAGTEADAKKAAAQRQEGREIQKTDAAVAASQATTAGQNIKNQVGQATIPDQIRVAGAEADRAVNLALASGSEVDIKKADAALKQQQQRVMASIPDETVRQEFLNKIEEQRAKIGLINAQADKARRPESDSRQPTAVADQERIWKETYNASPTLKQQFPTEADYVHHMQTNKGTGKAPKTGAEKLKEAAETYGGIELVPENLRKALERQSNLEMGLPVEPNNAQINALLANPTPDAQRMFDEAIKNPGAAQRVLQSKQQQQPQGQQQQQPQTQQQPRTQQAPAQQTTPSPSKGPFQVDPVMEQRIEQESREIAEGKRTTLSSDLMEYSRRKTQWKADEDVKEEQRRMLQRSRELVR